MNNHARSIDWKINYSAKGSEAFLNIMSISLLKIKVLKLDFHSNAKRSIFDSTKNSLHRALIKTTFFLVKNIFVA